MKKEYVNNITLPNSVRQDLWIDFKKYLIAQKQSKSSIRNKVGYAQRFYYILETKDANDILKLSHGSKVHTMKPVVSLSKFSDHQHPPLSSVKVLFHLYWQL